METLKKGLLVGLQTSWKIGKIIFPISFILTIIKETALMDWFVHLLEPLMSFIGLKGDAALVLVFGNVLNLYAALGAMLPMDLTMKEALILAVMLSFSHNLFVETSVASAVGVRASFVVFVRIGFAIISAICIHFFWSGGSEIVHKGIAVSETVNHSGWNLVYSAILSSLIGIYNLIKIVIPLMLVIQFAKDFGWMNYVTKLLSPFTKLIGVEAKAGVTLAAGLFFGLAFGAGVMIQAVKEDGVSKRDLYLVFLFLVACHAVVEDTLLFIPLGIPVLYLFLIRFFVALVVTFIVARIIGRVSRKAQSNLKVEVK
ncbi:nucleoside recognition domain-containing protein [Gottfriedia luciferensis]|uniref:nucleoside recognition domain-containing protein n=1 Tax=Gottfriedia luciferensis TaxID=178774 RepID=UPI000B44C6C7|nr:nucleoside recognition domain-containing protein [Gottfriedia luciferensis]